MQGEATFLYRPAEALGFKKAAGWWALAPKIASRSSSSSTKASQKAALLRSFSLRAKGVADRVIYYWPVLVAATSGCVINSRLPICLLTARAQDLMAIYDSLKMCEFSLFAGVKPIHMLTWLNYVTGWSMDMKESLQSRPSFQSHQNLNQPVKKEQDGKGQGHAAEQKI